MAPKQYNDEKSPFLKRVLVPFWAFRITIMLLNVLAYALVIGALGSYANDNNISLGSIITVVVLVLLVILVCMALDIVCIIKRNRRTLTPKAFLIISVIQTALWTVMFVVSMVGVGHPITSIVSIIVYASFIGVLIYASVLYHRSRKGTLNRGRKAVPPEPSESRNVAAGGITESVNLGGYYHSDPAQNRPIHEEVPRTAARDS